MCGKGAAASLGHTRLGRTSPGSASRRRGPRWRLWGAVGAGTAITGRWWAEIPRRGYRNPSCCVILAGDATFGRQVRPSVLEKVNDEGDGHAASGRRRGVRRGHGTH